MYGVIKVKGMQDLFQPGGKNTAIAQSFVVKSYLNMLTSGGVPIGTVTFAPGCRPHSHIHHAYDGGGQILLSTAGSAWYQAWGEPARKLRAGDVVVIPPEVKHWHGAAADSWFVHLAVEVPGKDTSNEWLEPVDDAAYAALEK